MISTTNMLRALALASITALVAAAPAPTPTAAPTPVSSATPIPLTLPTTGKNTKPVKPTPTPPPSRIGITGVWEVQVQPGGSQVDYVHFKLTQTGDALTGVYLNKNNTPYPLAGVVKGANVRIVVTLPKGGSLIFNGTVSGTTDMLGMMTDDKGEIAFTAGYRPKSNLFDNISPGAGMGGLGGNGGYSPPR